MREREEGKGEEEVRNKEGGTREEGKVRNRVRQL